MVHGPFSWVWGPLLVQGPPSWVGHSVSWAQGPPLGAGFPFLSTGSLLGHSVPPLGARSPFLGVGSPLRAASPPGHRVPLWVLGPPFWARCPPSGCQDPFLGTRSSLGAGSLLGMGSPLGMRSLIGTGCSLSCVRGPLLVQGPPSWVWGPLSEQGPLLGTVSPSGCWVPLSGHGVPPLGARPPFWAQGHSGVQTPLLVTVPPRNTCAVSPADPPRDPLLTAFLETQRGRLAIFQASVASNPPAELALHHGERLVASSSGGGLSPSPRVSAAAAPNSLRVEVREVTLRDEGSYRLTATNAFGTAVQRLFLHVQGERREGPWGWDGAPAASPGRGAEPHIRGRPVPSRAPRPLLAMGRAPK